MKFIVNIHRLHDMPPITDGEVLPLIIYSACMVIIIAGFFYIIFKLDKD